MKGCSGTGFDTFDVYAGGSADAVPVWVEVAVSGFTNDEVPTSVTVSVASTVSVAVGPSLGLPESERDSGKSAEMVRSKD